jgi:hypothetical protein
MQMSNAASGITSSRRAWSRLFRPAVITAVLGCNLLFGAGQCQEPAAVTFVCPHLRQYSVTTQDRALAEYRELPAGSALKAMIGDYQNLRDQVRACRGESKR